ncbi:lytic murein transglycosylase [Pseudooceanicola sp.]|uniref:lytic murein transglycosylase n=1 Tax=Pseudooceanicola sp. TaxID=1914328 RepID=UPI0026207D72|nr:lytic murein transglycosylase [Pseudooceanicola sp.]MDF1857283.1 lytic murein transglycosylase [Pseudooceanicola sp.]
MPITRRHVLSGGVAALALTGCGGTPMRVGNGTGRPRLAPPEPAFRPIPNPGWDAWVRDFRSRAAARGISAATLNTAFRGAGYLPGVIERDRNQTESNRTLEDYLAIVANDDKVQSGRAARASRRALLGEIETRYGVPAEVVAAIWGMESNYGSRRGDISVISATSTLAFDGRRGAFFEKQLMAALRILQRGDTTPAQMTGSWAGAMGHTQFIPTTFDAYAVDFRGDGRRDIWSDDPTDALASAAAYLAKSGWRRGTPWGYEVRLPGGGAPIGSTRALSDWASAGLTRANGGRLSGAASARLIQPAGANSPAFLTLANFRVILRYNNAEKYAIGVGHLSDRIAGGGPLRATFPPDRHGLSLQDRKRLQTRLNGLGYDLGTPDGVLGKKSEAAIRAYQRANGMAETGTPSPELLARLG